MANDRQRDRFDALAPRDLVVTLRSLDRRFHAITDRAGNEQLSAVLDRPGPSGDNLGALLAGAARGAALVGSAVETGLDATDPVVAHAVLDPSERVFTDDRDWSIEASVDTIATEAERAAARVEKASANALSRDVAVTGAAGTTPLATAQQMARELIGALNASDRHVEWLEAQV